ncbi:MAG: hypothetical protein VB071_04420 [Lawsonibacter sp.]|nr:hypothetical protein [Lawsonibacter sp.]
MDQNGPIITALLMVYQEGTGNLNHLPTVIGCGTYAGAMAPASSFPTTWHGQATLFALLPVRNVLQRIPRNFSKIHRK